MIQDHDKMVPRPFKDLTADETTKEAASPLAGAAMAPIGPGLHPHHVRGAFGPRWLHDNYANHVSTASPPRTSAWEAWT